MHRLLLPLLLATACDSQPNLFTLQDDIDLGEQLAAEIAANPEEYPLLSREDFPDAYARIDAMKNRILAAEAVQHSQDFNWALTLIDDDDTLNAFAAPGGQMYVYTGLVRFLDTEDDLAGVMGHEIAHADQRHSTEQLTKAYGIATLLTIALGENPGLLAELAQSLVQLQFSRTDESEADGLSVQYLCDTVYAANGAANFFRKLDGASVPAFLSTHPNPDNRVEAIDARAAELGCSIEPWAEGDYQGLLDALP